MISSVVMRRWKGKLKFYFVIFIIALIWLISEKDIGREINKTKPPLSTVVLVYVALAIIVTLIVGLPIGGILYLFT